MDEDLFINSDCKMIGSLEDWKITLIHKHDNVNEILKIPPLGAWEELEKASEEFLRGEND